MFLLTVGTFSLYFYVHLGLMWAEVRRARQDYAMNPVGHAFAQFVPIYGWFRFYAHVRTLDEMLRSAGSPKRLSAAGATAVLVGLLLFRWFAPQIPTFPLWLVLPSYGAAYGVFAAWRQGALNNYYDQISAHSTPERVHGLEWVVMTLGTLFLVYIVSFLA